MLTIMLPMRKSLWTMATRDSGGRCACSQPSSSANGFGSAPSTAISDRIRRNCRALNPSGLPKSPSPTSRQATLCNSARVSTSDSPMRRRSRVSLSGAGVELVITDPSTKSITNTGTSSSSPASAVANTPGAGTRVCDNAVSSFASRSTSWAPGGSGGWRWSAHHYSRMSVRHQECQVRMPVADGLSGDRRAAQAMVGEEATQPLEFGLRPRPHHVSCFER